MKKFAAVIAITAGLLIFVITQAQAETKVEIENKTGKNEVKIEKQENGVQIKIEQKNDEKIFTKIRVKPSEMDKRSEKWKGFHFKGVISNVSTNSFVIQGKTVELKPTVTGKLHIKGSLKNGAYVKVEGKTMDGKYYAKEIKVENKNKDKDDDDNNVTPTPTLSVTPSLSPTPSSTPTGTVERTGDQVKITLSGSIQDIIKSLEELLTTLKSWL